MKTIAVLLFGTGVLLAVQVMFFGVGRTIAVDAFSTRAWPLTFAAILASAGAVLYVQSWREGGVTGTGIAAVVIVSGLAGAGAWWTVRRSAAAAAATQDPDEDPRYQFQGHVARIVSTMPEPKSGGGGGGGGGRIAFVIDGRTLELEARWLPGTTVAPDAGSINSEVVIERVDGKLALVEPWALVESRL